MFGKILLIVIVAFLVTLLVVLIVKSCKKKTSPQPNPNPTSDVPVYEYFLNSVETVVRNNLNEEELDIYLDSIESQIELYTKEPGFSWAFQKLLSKYNISL